MKQLWPNEAAVTALPGPADRVSANPQSEPSAIQ
jgi:hypothetical protein